MLRHWRVWLGVAISLVFLALAFRGVQLSEAWQALRTANYLFILPGLLSYFVGVWLRSVRWGVLLRPVKDMTARQLFPTVVIGYMANNILPLRMGELVRAYFLGEQEKISKTSTLATIVVERMFDGLSMIGFLIIILWLFPAGSGEGAEGLRTILNVGGPLFLLALILFLVIASSRSLALRVTNAGLRLVPVGPGQKLGGVIASFLDGLAVLRSPKDVMTVFVLSVIIWLFEAGMYYIIGFGFGLDKPFYVMVLATAAANLATIVPSTPGYVGVFDAPVKATLTAFAVDPSVALSFTLVLHAALWVPVTLLGVYYLWREGLSLGWLASGQATSSGKKE